MNKLTKKIMALMLSLVMILACVPYKCFAEDAPKTLTIKNVKAGANKSDFSLEGSDDISDLVIKGIYLDDGTDQGTTDFEKFELDKTYYIHYSFKSSNNSKFNLVKGEDALIDYDNNYTGEDVYEFSIPNKSHGYQWMYDMSTVDNYVDALFEGMITFRIDDWSTLACSIEGTYPTNVPSLFTVKDSNDKELYSVKDTGGIRTITLLSDMNANASDYALSVPSNMKVVLDLNGHILNRGLVAENGTITNPKHGSVIEVLGGDLTITDSNQTIEHKGKLIDGLWILDENNGTVTIKGGIITGGTGRYHNQDIYRGGGIYVDYEDTTNPEKKAGSLVLEKGTICGNAGVGGGICVANSSYFTMNDGKISYNKNGNTDNNSTNPAGIMIEKGTFIMNGGEVSYNVAKGTKSVGGIYPGNNTTINGGKIIGNSSEKYAGGIFNLDQYKKFTISGKVIIKDNSCSAKNSDDAPLQQNLSTYFPININKLEDGSEIHITFGYTDHTKGILTSGFQTNNPGAYYGDFFTYDGPEKFYMALNADGELEIKQKDPEKYLITILKSENGTALADKTEAGKDEEVTLNAIPKSGYMLEEFIVTDADSNPITVEDGKFVMPEKNVSITATFKEAPKSSGTKKYKADDKDTAEKISGTGKKGSTRIITPIEGKKVASVIVTDKDGNKIDITLNEDGTYSFVQPASNVNVEVTYKNREITLNIGSTKAEVDGEKSNLDVCPVIRNDRTMLPIRFIAENLGAKVEWNELESNMVYITRGDIKIEIKLGSEIMKVNDKEVILDQVAFAENDRTYLPVRAVSEALNAIVEWNENEPSVVKIYER